MGSLGVNFTMDIQKVMTSLNLGPSKSAVGVLNVFEFWKELKVTVIVTKRKKKQDL